MFMGVSWCTGPICEEEIQTMQVGGDVGEVHSKLQYLLSSTSQYYHRIPTLGRIQCPSFSTVFIAYS